MANFPVFHGITLAANAYVENLNLEILSADPSPVAAGRVWFNSTDKVVRYSSLNSSGAVVVRTIKDAESAATELAAVQASVAAEAARATAAEGVLTSSVAAEVTRATAAEAALNSKIDQTKADILGGIPPSGYPSCFVGHHHRISCCSGKQPRHNQCSGRHDWCSSV